MRTKYIILGIMGLLLLLLILSLFTGPKRVNWNESFNREDKNPFGTYALYALLPDLFPESDIETTSKETYYTLEDPFYTPTSYVVITNHYGIDNYDLEELLEFIADGNTAFINARRLPDFMLDTLGLEMTSPLPNYLVKREQMRSEDSVNVRFANPRFKEYTGFDLSMASEHWGFELEEENEINENIKVLAFNQYNVACLLKIPFGDGYMVLGSTPRMFSNYFVVEQGDHQFASAALSYLPKETDLLWDEYYESGQSFGGQGKGENGEGGPDLLSFISSEPALNWAYWIVAFAILIYVIFESKRKQRVIPERKPLPNATLEFTETVGRLYYRSHDHKNVADKKIKILLAYIRSQYFLKTTQFTPAFIETLSGKSGMPLNETRILCRTIERIRKREYVTESELLELNLLVETFYQISHGRK